MFSIGQKIVCIDSRDYRVSGKHVPLIEGKTYRVVNSMQCNRCGLVAVDVGLSGGAKSVCICGHEFKSRIWWFDANRFLTQWEDIELDVKIKSILWKHS